MRRWTAPALWSIAVLAAAPFMGWIRDRLLERLGRGFALTILALLAVVVLAVLSRAAARIWDHRFWRWGAVALVALLIGVQTVFFQRGDARVDMVERIHLVEYGLLSFLVYRAARPRRDLGVVLIPLLWILAVGTLDEWLQWWAPTRIGDWRDVVLNLFAGLCGLLLALAINPPGRLGPVPAASRRRLGYGAALALLLVAGYFHSAHLGYRIEAPRIGAFRSWYSVEGLAEAARDRAVLWSVQAPGALPLLGREDLFRTEAAWHLAHRNASRDRGELGAAWMENRILEVYYAPFLEHLPRHRLPDPQREKLRVRRPRPDRFYESPVLSHRILVRPSKRVFWGLVVLFTGLLIFAARVAGRRSG